MEARRPLLANASRETLVPLDPLNFVPFTRTPWGGSRIAELKASGLGLPRDSLPAHVGESWEASTDPLYPSRVASRGGATLPEVLAREGDALLGAATIGRYGNHCPLLLKWLHAADVLSVQLHPRNGHPQLRIDECGKPESWLVLEAEPGGYLYLGLREGVSPEACRAALMEGRPADVLHRHEPRAGEIISVPPGLVHAVGPGLLLAEPQYVLPGKSGKTWRLSDWGRLYDAAGRVSPSGAARELHLEEAFDAIGWDLPRESRAVAALCHSSALTPRFLGDKHNPFATHVFTSPGMHVYEPLIAGAFSLATCYAGIATFGTVVLRAGETGVVPARADRVAFSLTPDDQVRCGLAFFGLNSVLAEAMGC